ncbi:MAG: hypothetical protein LW808_001915 [Verrucomicrobiota bacterium]|nr:MAG: hypothetical protein LW808_001915 [Verrucomicrobiota bacterium]
MTDVDFHNFDRQPIGQYAEVANIKAQQMTSSKVIEAGNYVFTVTMSPRSKWSWWQHEEGVLSLGTPDERDIFPAEIPFKNKKELSQLLQAPQLLGMTLELISWIDFDYPRRSHLEALNELNEICRNPQAPLILCAYIQKYQVSELLSNPGLLNWTLGFTESINDSHLESKDIESAKHIGAVIRAPGTPSAIREIALKKTYAIHKVAIGRAVECAYGIPQKIMNQTQGEGSYRVIYTQPNQKLEKELREHSSLTSTLSAARNKVAELFYQMGSANYHERLDSAVIAYSDLIIQVLADGKYNKTMGNRAVIQELNASKERISTTLTQELSTYTKNHSALCQDLQSFEKRMRAFENELLQVLLRVPNGYQYQLNIQEAEGFMYCDIPLSDEIETPFETNTLIIADTHLDQPWNERTIDEIREEIVFVRGKLEKYLQHYKGGRVDLESPSEYTQKIAQKSVEYTLKLISDYFPKLHHEAEKRLFIWDSNRIDRDVLNAFGTLKASHQSRTPGQEFIQKINTALNNLVIEWEQCSRVAKQVREDLMPQKTVPAMQMEPVGKQTDYINYTRSKVDQDFQRHVNTFINSEGKIDTDKTVPSFQDPAATSMDFAQ